MTSRYVGKPFLRLIECYVLDAIGQLEPQHASALKLMEPKLGETYGMQGAWQEIVAAQMGFPESLPSKIRAVWEGQSEEARRLAPNQFAIHFVDQNFPDSVATPL